MMVCVQNELTWIEENQGYHPYIPLMQHHYTKPTNWCIYYVCMFPSRVYHIRQENKFAQHCICSLLVLEL